MLIGHTTTSKGATGPLVDHSVVPSSVDNIHPSAPETASDHSQQDIPKTASDSDAQQDMIKIASDAQQDMIKIASDAHQHTPKGNYCALCKKVHD
jgi:hypothetical protein